MRYIPLLFIVITLACAPLSLAAPSATPAVDPAVATAASFPATFEPAAAEKTDDYVIFSINVQDFSYPAESAAVLDKIITLHEKYNLPVDIYLTDGMAKIYAEQFPALLERLKTSPVVAISYHYRAPRPYANSYDWLGLEQMTPEQQYQTVMQYETHAVDPVTGLTTDEAGGYQYVASLIGYPPYAGSAITPSGAIDDTVIKVYTELGAQMTVVHGRINNLGDIKKGLYVRPEHFDYMLFQQVGKDAAQSFEAALAEAHNAQGAAAPYFIGVKMHDNDFFAEKSAWLTVYLDGGKRAPWNPELKAALLSQAAQDAVWTMYEQTLIYVASQQGRITPVNLPIVLDMIQ